MSHYIAVGAFSGIRNVIFFAAMVSLADSVVPACDAAVEKRRALEQIAPDSRLVVCRPLHIRVCNEVRLKTLRSDSVANHAGPRGPCEKRKCARKWSAMYLTNVSVADYRVLSSPLSQAFAHLAISAADGVLLSEPQNLLTCDSKHKENIISNHLTFPTTSIQHSRSQASLNRDLGPSFWRDQLEVNLSP